MGKLEDGCPSSTGGDAEITPDSRSSLSDCSEPLRKCAQADRVVVAGLGGSALEIRGKTNEPARQRNQGAALRPPGRVQTLALQRHSEPAGADHVVLKNSGEDRLRWGVVSGNAFRYLLHREQQIVDECDERIGAIEDAVERFGSHGGASTYGDDHDRPESTLHLDLAGQGAVPYRQGNANRNGESQLRLRS